MWSKRRAWRRESAETDLELEISFCSPNTQPRHLIGKHKLWRLVAVNPEVGKVWGSVGARREGTAWDSCVLQSVDVLCV